MEKCPAIIAVFASCLTLVAQEFPDPEKKSPPSAEDALMEDLPVVQAAAMHKQTLQEAPANVTVISRAEIRKYGYHTFGEALNSVRCFYTTYDRIYHYAGVSGFSLPGDFNTRFLVMINGHSMTEHVYDSSNFFGEDFGLDLDLVERIEIIRGSTSALYGSNAMLATINIITRSPADMPGFRASTENGSFGERKLFVSDSVYLGRGANLLLSASFFDNGGQTLYIPQLDSPATKNGIAAHSDGEIGYHTFANLVWGDWNFTAYFNTRRKQVPVNWADNTVFADGGSHVRDGRNFIEAARSQDIGMTGKLRYRFYYDDYRYDDRFDYSLRQAEDQRSLSRNEWLGSEITWNHPFTSRGDLTVGVQGEWELRNLQSEYAVSPSPSQLFRIDIPNRTIALFTQQEWRLTSRWKAYVGLRFDRSHNYGNALSPRIALVYQSSPSTVYKAATAARFATPAPLRSTSMTRKLCRRTRVFAPNALRLGLPVAAHRAFLASSGDYMSARWTNGGSQVRPVVLQDLTITTTRPLTGVDLQAGIRNIWDRRVDDPVGLAVDTMRQDGRSFFVKLIWHGSE